MNQTIKCLAVLLLNDFHRPTVSSSDDIQATSRLADAATVYEIDVILLAVSRNMLNGSHVSKGACNHYVVVRHHIWYLVPAGELVAVLFRGRLWCDGRAILHVILLVHLAVQHVGQLRHRHANYHFKPVVP